MKDLHSILNSCIKDDRLAQKKLYEMYYGKLMVVTRRYANNRDEALEILNNGFLKIFKNIPKFVGSKEQNFDGWVHRIMVNTAIDFYRSELKYQHDEIDSNLYVESKSNIIENITVNEIIEEINKLPPGYRTAFNMYVLDGYTHKEIAELLGITEGTSKSNLSKARAKLQEIINAKNEKKNNNHESENYGYHLNQTNHVSRI